MLEYEQKVNSEETSKNKILYGDFKNNLAFFRKKTGIKEENENQGNLYVKFPTLDEDMIQIVNILNSVKDGVDIYEGLSYEEKNQLACLLDYYKEEKQVYVKEEEPQPEEPQNVEKPVNYYI